MVQSLCLPSPFKTIDHESVTARGQRAFQRAALLPLRVARSPDLIAVHAAHSALGSRIRRHTGGKFCAGAPDGAPATPPGGGGFIRTALFVAALVALSSFDPQPLINSAIAAAVAHTWFDSMCFSSIPPKLISSTQYTWMRMHIKG
jgi:hypothetical protein